MKRIICLMLICVTALAASLLPAPDGGLRTSEAFIDRTNAASEYDPRAAMGEDVLEQLEKASPEARVTYRAGEITVTEPPSRDVSDIEPYIPEGLEIAKPYS